MKNESVTFESQLELGEMLLNVGRIEDAAVELIKARQLRDRGVVSRSDSDPQRKIDAERLQTALSKVEGIQSQQVRTTNLWRMALAALLGIALLTVFTLFILNRAAVVNTNSSATRNVAQMNTRQAEISQLAAMAEKENTRTADEIDKQRSQIATVSAANTRIAGIAGAQEELATAEAIATFAAATVTKIHTERATPTLTPVISSTPRSTLTSTPAVPVWDKLQVVAEGRSNLRSGPGTIYGVVTLLDQGQIVGWVAQNSSGDWYNVQTSDGVVGWVHSSIVLPLAMVDMPVAATLPATPFVLPTFPPPEPVEDGLPPTATALP